MNGNRAKTVLKWIVIRLPELIAAAALIVALSVTAVNAFTRYVLKWTYAGSDEIVCIAFAWLVFPGAAAAFRRKMHYGIDLLVNAFPRKVQAFANILTQLLITIILCTVTYLSLVLVQNVGTKIMTATRISYQVLDSAMLVGFGLMSLYSIIFLIQDIRGLPEKLRGQEGASV